MTWREGVIGCFLCFFVSTVSYSQTELRSQLQDAEYVMNRFEEVTTGFDSVISRWSAPDSTKNAFRQELASVSRNVIEEKAVLQALLDKPGELSAAELFDVYSELVEAANELSSQSANDGLFGDGGHSVELSRLGAKTLVLGAQIGVKVRDQIAVQELQLAHCPPKSIPKTQTQTH